MLTTDWTYVRFHGPAPLTDRYRGLYGPSRLEGPAERLAGWQAEGHDAYAYFNNDQHGHAVTDATWLRKRLALSAR